MDEDFLKHRFAALSLYVDALGLWDPLFSCPFVRDFLASEPLDAVDRRDTVLVRALAASWDENLVQWLWAQYERIMAHCFRFDCTSADSKRLGQNFKLLSQFAYKQASVFEMRDEVGNSVRCVEIAERCTEATKLIDKGQIGSTGNAMAEVKAFEQRLYALFDRSETCFECPVDDSSSRSLQAARRVVVGVHNDILSLMRDMLERRHDMDSLKDNGDTEIISAIAALDELQRNTADFEVTWSRRAAAFLSAQGKNTTDKDQLAAMACGDVSGAGTSRPGKFSSELEDRQEKTTDEMFEL